MICYNSRAADEHAEKLGRQTDEDAAVEAYYESMMRGLKGAHQAGHIDGWQYDLLVKLTETDAVDYEIRCMLKEARDEY
jgi:hypothetical protein